MSQTDYMIDLILNTEFATGADVSHWKGEWNLANVDIDMFEKAMDFMILRAGYGAADGKSYKDRMFDSHYKVLLNYPKILRGVYWYFSSNSKWETQFNNFMSYVGDKDFDFYALDFEEAYNDRSSKFANDAISFLKALKERTGKRVILYCGDNTYDNWLSPYTNKADDWPLWTPHYPWYNWVNWDKWSSGTVAEFKHWWEYIFKHAYYMDDSGKRWPYMPKARAVDDYVIWQMIAASGLGKRMGFVSDELDFNITNMKKEEFIQWIGVPERWGDVPEPPVEPPNIDITSVEEAVDVLEDVLQALLKVQMSLRDFIAGCK